MAKKVVDLTIKLKDGVTGTLRKIGSGLKGITRAFKGLAIAGVAATTAIVAGLTAVAKAYAEQESVNRKLKDTFDAMGESGAKAVAKWGAWATQIQRVTTLGDEEIMNLISLAKTMGIANDEIANATKGAIGLSKAFGIDLNSSMKMVALATQGEYTMLQRYIPALRAATTEAEKAAIVQEAMAHGFKVAQGELHTITGQWTALKGVIGDAMQEIGRVLFGDGGLVSGLEAVKNKIIEMTENGAITKWANQAKVALDAVVETIKLITKGGEGRTEVLKAIGNVLKQAFKSAAIGAVQMLAKYAPKIGMAIARPIIDLIPGVDFSTPEIKGKEAELAQVKSDLAREYMRFGGKDQEAALESRRDELMLEIGRLRADMVGGKIEAGTDTLDSALFALSKTLEKYAEESQPSPADEKKKNKDQAEAIGKATEEGVRKGIKSAAEMEIIYKALEDPGELTGSIYEKDDDKKKKKDYTPSDTVRGARSPDKYNLPYEGGPDRWDVGFPLNDGVIDPMGGASLGVPSGGSGDILRVLNAIEANTKGGLL